MHKVSRLFRGFKPDPCSSYREMHHIGMYLLQGQDVEGHPGIKDMAQSMRFSPSSQSKHPAPLMILRSQ